MSIKKKYFLEVVVVFFFFLFLLLRSETVKKNALRGVAGVSVRRGQDRQPPGDVTDCGSEAGGGGGGHLLVCYGRFPSCQSV